MSRPPSDVPVTRVEIIDAVESAFAEGPATTPQLIAAAVRHESRDELVATLHRLPDRRFIHVRDLWQHLPDIPVEN